MFPFVAFLFFYLLPHTVAGKPHVVSFRSPNLFPESLAWENSGQHFLLGSLRYGTLHTVSDAGIIQPFISDPDFSGTGAAVVGIAVDPYRRRLLAVVRNPHALPSFDALAAYDLQHRHRLFLSRLDAPGGDSSGANDVAVDSSGNAFVTNSLGNFIWKVTINGTVSVFSRSPLFTSQHVYSDRPASWCGLNGISHTKGNLLVVQSNSGKLFRVDSGDGTARVVSVPKDLTGADGVAVRRDGVVVVVSHHTAWFLKSNNNWMDAVVYDEITLNVSGFPSGVTVRSGEKVYVLNGAVNLWMENGEREEFSIEEIESPKEREGENVWVFVLVGLGFAYFCYWRFQMGQLVRDMTKKRA